LTETLPEAEDLTGADFFTDEGLLAVVERLLVEVRAVASAGTKDTVARINRARRRRMV